MTSLTVRQVLVLVAGVVLVLTACVGIYGLMHGVDDRTAANAAPRGSATLRVVTGPTPSAPPLVDRALPETNDPIAYARAVAVSLFEWDSSAGFLPTDYTAPVLADTDPSGEETPGLLTDVATYLPTVEQWLDLAAMHVVQTIDIESASVPDSWPSLVTHDHGSLRPGTTAVTVTGTRHRSGVWHGEIAKSSYPVSFTVFVACRPSFDRCHVLRLSQLDNPLR